MNHSNIWTISGYDDDDDWYTKSNYGNPPIEYAGPAVAVPSLDIGSGVTNKTGTSMAAPHIAGLLLTIPNNINVDGYVNNDPDNDADPIAAFMPLEVTISGPEYRESGQQGTWTANPQYGTGSYSYQWYYKTPGGSTWQTGGTSNSYNHTFNNPGTTAENAGIKVEVASGNEQAEDQVTVIVNGEDCPSGQLCL